MSRNIWHKLYIVQGVCGHVMLSKLPDGEGRGSTIFLPSPKSVTVSKSGDVLNDFVMEGMFQM